MKKTILIFLVLGGLLAACAPSSQAPSATHTPQPVASPRPTATDTPQPTATSTPSPTVAPTSTPSPTPTPDYSAIRYLRAQNYYSPDGVLQTVFVLDVGDLQDAFHVVVHNHDYDCLRFDEYPGQVWCYGPYLPPGWEDTLYVYPQKDAPEPVFTQVFGLPLQPTPTLYGVTCTYEPLSAIGQSDDSSCYAITCYYQGKYYGGTKNSCTNPWP
jgi:hypothetical protein